MFVPVKKSCMTGARRANNAFGKKHGRGTSCAFKPEQIQALLAEAWKDSDFYGTFFTVCALTGAKVSQVCNARWSDVRKGALLIRQTRIASNPVRHIEKKELIDVLNKWYIKQGTPAEDAFIFHGRVPGKAISRKTVDDCLRKMCVRVNIQCASTHSFRLSWMEASSPQDIAQIYSRRTVGNVFRSDVSGPSTSARKPNDPCVECEEATAPPPLLLDAEWGMLAGAHAWQPLTFVDNSAGDLVPDAPTANGLYVVRLQSKQAYIGMSTDLKARMIVLRHAPRMIGALPGGGVWILQVPRIYNLALLEEIYMDQTSPCLNQIWDDLRFDIFPRTQACMTYENKCCLVDAICNRHRVATGDA